MKAGSLAVIVFLAVVPAHAQQAPPVSPATPSQPPASLSVPNPFPSQPPVSLSVPNPFAGTPRGVDLYRSPDGSDRFVHGAQFPPRPGFFAGHGGYVPGAVYGYAGAYDPYVSMLTPEEQLYYRYVERRFPILSGGLVLETLPDLTQVFIDGFFVGVAEEFGLRGHPMDLAIGPHRIELRAPGYETVSFSVNIEPNTIVRYRGDLQSLSRPMPIVVLLSRPAPPPKTLYIIPNCYAGDKPPVASALPEGCSVKNLRTRK
jgi:hypothetical protein